MTDVNVLDKLGKVMVVLGFVGIYLSAAVSDAGNDLVLCIVPALASLGVMLGGAAILRAIDKRCVEEE